MAWDNAHGVLSADERHRLEREAEIFAEAQRKMLQEEAARAEKQRDADERRRAEERRREESFRHRSEETQRRKQEKSQWENSSVGIANRVKNVKSSHVGSPNYLRARYGYYVYDSKYYNTYRLKYGWQSTSRPCYDDHSVEELIEETYSQTDKFWKSHECEQLEQLLGSEEHERADYEPKCRPLIKFIAKLKAEQQAKQQAEQTLNDRIDMIGASKVGSIEYLKARYGEHAYRLMLDTVIQELNIGEETAAVYLTDNYSESLWKPWEDETIEQLIGNR